MSRIARRRLGAVAAVIVLLGTAAIAFTAVAWTTFGVVGRAAILGVVTLIALALPLVALLRKLRATAETFVAIGLLLVILDGYAAWSVNLADVQSIPSSRYSGIVLAVTAAVALAYRAFSHLVGPSFAALLTVQPVIFLVVEPANADATASMVVVEHWDDELKRLLPVK